VYRLALGTAQFGMRYGITNQQGIPDDIELKKILDFARESEITELDTAPAYGNAHNRIAELGANNFSITTKLLAHTSADEIRQTVFNMLEQLKCKKIHGLLLHSQEDAMDQTADARFDVLNQLKQEGFIDSIGVSIYDPEHMEFLLNHHDIDIIQCPLNPLNATNIASLQTAGKTSKKIKLVARSVFLQGVLLCLPKQLPEHLPALSSAVIKFQEFCREINELPGVVALSYLRQFNLDSVIVGVSSLTELQEIVAWFTRAKTLRVEVPNILFHPEFDPRTW
jgi:aryl-alcohol dehydrogenase-like predicted oxidoreductase